MDTKIIWETYADDVRRFVFNKTKSDDITNDLVQEIFIKVHTKIGTLRNVKRLKSWLLAIAKNTTLDYLKSLQQKEKIEQNSNELIDRDPTVVLEHSEEDCLYGIVTKLPKKYRDPLFMADIKGMKQAVIADLLKLPLPTVKSQVQRARKMITQGYIDCCGFELNEKGFLVGAVKSKEECKVCD